LTIRTGGRAQTFPPVNKKNERNKKMALPQIIAYPIPTVAGGFYHENNLIELRAAADRARGFIENSRSDATKRAYRSDWIHFSTWCESRGFDSLPATAESILLYLSKFSESLKISSLSRHLVSISQAHKLAGYPSPTKDVRVREMLTGMKRTLMQSPNKKKALLMRDIRAMLENIPPGLKGTRDRAIILLGFSGAFRRSELTGLDIADVEFSDDGAVIRLRHSKTDQIFNGSAVGIPYGSKRETCPVRSLRAWIDALAAVGFSDGRLFRSINRHGVVSGNSLSSLAVAEIVKHYAGAAGLESSLYSGHSLRSGFATQADLSGARFSAIKAQGRWQCDTIVHGYMQRSGLFEDNAAAKLGL
jgi:site-specific recombinase XerD